MKNFRDTEEFSPQEVEAAQNDLTNVLLLEQFYNTTHNEVYPIALDLINKGKFIVTDSTLEDASYHKKCLEQGIISCQIFIYSYDNGKFTPAMKAFKATSASRREEFEEMWSVFEQALDIVKDGFLRYKLIHHGSDTFRDILRDGSDFQSIKKTYRHSFRFDIMLHNCEYILDTAADLDFDIKKDAVLDNFIKQVKKLLYKIRSEKEVEDLFNAPWHEDVRAAFKALYDEDDPQKAMRLYEKAAAAGSGEAMYELGQLYRHFWNPCILAGMHGSSSVHPVAKDGAKAIEWYRKAADANYAPAMETLGSCYESGDYVIKDIHEAIRWYKKAASFGSATAAGTLAHIYQEGVRVPQDTTEAQRWREMRTFDGFFENIKKIKAEAFSPVAPWMNSDAKSVELVKSVEPVKSGEKKAPVVTENSSQKFSDTEKNTSREFSREDYPGLAFWIVLMGLYCLTPTDFISSLIVAIIAFAVVNIMV